jgi:hypothetical protein
MLRNTLIFLTVLSVYAFCQFTIPKEEPSTVYTKRHNWAHPRPDYYTTTQHADKEGRFDTSIPPSGDYTGTATAKFTNLPPGKYTVQVFYRLSENRAKSVPWKVTTDANTNNTASGTVDQWCDGCNVQQYFILEETATNPLDVQSELTLVWSTDDPNNPDFSRRSISYGGAKIMRVGQTGLENLSASRGFQLSVRPNPFKGSIVISYQLSAISKKTVPMNIYNVNGKLVEKLIANSQQLKAGITWNASHLSPGIYILKANVQGQSFSKKLFLQK